MNYREVTWEGKLNENENENEKIAVELVERQRGTGSIGNSVCK